MCRSFKDKELTPWWIMFRSSSTRSSSPTNKDAFIMTGSSEKRGGMLDGRLTPTRLALLVAGLLALLLLLQQAGLLPSDSSWRSAALDRINIEMTETRNAMEAMKALTMQKPWQEVGQCANQLEAAKKEIETLKAGGGGSASSAVVAGAACPNCETCQATACPECSTVPEISAEQLAKLDPSGVSADLKKELDKLKDDYKELRTMYDRIVKEKSNLDAMSGFESKLGDKMGDQNSEVMKAAKAAIEKCGAVVAPAAIGSGNSTAVGYACEATVEEMAQYLNYTVRGLCPDDWFFVQDLIFVKNCYCLPKRRCLARTARSFVDPLPLPGSLFNQQALDDTNVRWDLHHCKNFDCLNHRVEGDCRNCFNMTLESHRWRSMYRGAIKMADVIEMKKGSLRIGLDAGGGTGSFAAQMAKHGVTMMTTAMNVETVFGKYQGLPYMETIALRGLIPLHWPHKARLPFFDNTLDVIHSVNSIKYLELIEFEELVMEWDRVLRPGGIMWFEMFYTPVEEMPLYIAILDYLKYKKLYWNVTPKPDEGERPGQHLYLNCVIEKPARQDTI